MVVRAQLLRSCEQGWAEALQRSAEAQGARATSKGRGSTHSQSAKPSSWFPLPRACASAVAPSSSMAFEAKSSVTRFVFVWVLV